MEKLSPDHVVRAGSLPWRSAEDAFTECGLPIAGHPTISRDELIRRMREWGRTRTALTVCMTCWTTATRYKRWAEDPVDAVRREVNGGRGQPDLLRRELRAIETLIAEHREEFDAVMAGLAGTVDLAAQRRARSRRR